MKRADLVIVLECGRVTQTGTHADLVTRDGHYREIVAMQLQHDTAAGQGDERASHMDRMRAESGMQSTESGRN